eukprot:scaffold60399_cov70-Cyclotella_meneghiniana.AAC.1
MIRTALRLSNKPLPTTSNQPTSAAYRAVSRTDLTSSGGSPPVAPSATSPEETMMPWNGWFSSFLQSKLGEERYQSLRKLVLYRPDSYTNFEQMPRPVHKLPISESDPNMTHQFRQPSPGSQPAVQLDREQDPSFGNAADDPYNVAYYKRDTGRRYTSDPAAKHRDIEEIKLSLLPSDDPRVQQAKEELAAGPGSSGGNSGVFATGKSNYDPTGLRASMSTSWKATEESLDANMPDHLPTPVWASSVEKENELLRWYEERDLPVPIGGVGFDDDDDDDDDELNHVVRHGVYGAGLWKMGVRYGLDIIW